MIAIVSVFIIMAIPKMALNLFEVSTIPSIVDCRQRGCGYNISAQRWLADSVVRQDITAFKLIVNIEIEIEKDPFLQPPESQFWNDDNFERYLVLFNSSLNFVIYCLVGSNFRKTLRKTILFFFRQTEEQREEVLMTENNKNENTGASVIEMSLFDTEDEQTEDEANIEGNILLVSRC